MANHLANAFPDIGQRLPIVELGDLPTPVDARTLSIGSASHEVLVKHDDRTGRLYGGNKVRKLEYLLRRAHDRGARRVATFGTVGSNHALATAVYARALDFGCTCFLAHEAPRRGLATKLLCHQQLGTELVLFGGRRSSRIAALRRHLHGRRSWVIPLGGTCWLSTVGFVNAGLELAAQLRDGDMTAPRRVYVAFGTMGTAVGLALGLALAGIDAEVQAIRVTETRYASAALAARLLNKTALLMRACDASIPADLAARARLSCRDEFFAGGYGRSDAATERAIDVARDELGIALEPTYTGKAMAALLADLDGSVDPPWLFWNTYNSRPLNIGEDVAPDFNLIPRDFERYFD